MGFQKQAFWRAMTAAALVLATSSAPARAQTESDSEDYAHLLKFLDNLTAEVKSQPLPHPELETEKDTTPETPAPTTAPGGEQKSQRAQKKRYPKLATGEKKYINHVFATKGAMGTSLQAKDARFPFLEIVAVGTYEFKARGQAQRDLAAALALNPQRKPKYDTEIQLEYLTPLPKKNATGQSGS